MSDSFDSVGSMTSDATAYRLDSAQQRVIEASPVASGVVIGAPGTGKTHTVVDRIVALLDTSGAAPLTPDQVLVLTSSRQAATQLRDRIGVRVSVATPGPLARSLGSFAFQIVRGAMVRAGFESPALLTGADQDRIIADMLAGDEEDELHAASRWPEEVTANVRASQGFRSELRAFIAECTELGVSTAELRTLPEGVWSSVASFTDEYRGVLDHMRAAHRDAADLLAEAAVILRTAETEVLGSVSSLRVVLIDDAQELTHGGLAVVRALRDRGVAVLAFGDPDISSGAFRGASPELFAQLATLLGDVYVLDVPHRQDQREEHPLVSLTRRVTQAIGAAGRVEHRRPPITGEQVDEGAAVASDISTFLAPSPHEEFDRIAGILREWRLLHGVAWDDMAVIAHDTRQVTTLEVELAAREVPTRAAGVQRPLGRENVVRDVVGIVRLAMTPAEERDPDQLAEALRTPFGGLDGVGLRRLRARLRHRELEAGGTTPARELVRNALSEPAMLVLIDTPEARTADRFGTVLRDVSAAAERGETIHELLWRVWSAARSGDGRSLATAWQDAATTSGGTSIAQALDALVALFDAAKRSVERSPEDRPEVFIHNILDSEVPEDSLSAPDRPGLVTLLTPATALGTEFDAVVIAGVQDGVWPNVRLRGGALDTWRLSAAVAAARSGEPEQTPDALDRRRSALHDELRLFVRALSRARKRLVVTAVDDEDASPSALFALLPPPPPPHEHAAAEHPLTLRGLVAKHRRTLTSSSSLPARTHAAEQLAILAEEGVSGAEPEDWFGVAAASSTEPLRDLTTQPVRVSPSRMEAFETCALDWVIRALGGETGTWSAGLGTILHAAMEEAPNGSVEDLARIVDDRWGELEFEAHWLERKERRWADLLVARLHAYLAKVEREGGRTVGSEMRFELDIDLDAEDGPKVVGARTVDDSAPFEAADAEAGRARAVLSGSIDRVELYPPGRGENIAVDKADADRERVVIIDLKTGRSEKRFTDASVADHAQLAAYQLAFTSGAIEGAADAVLAGSRLVLLSKTLKNSQYRIAHQAPHDDAATQAFIERLEVDARGMAAAHFVANIDTHCHSDRFAVCTVHTIKAVSAS